MIDWPFDLPDGYPHSLGYQGNRRFVGIFNSPATGELIFEDGDGQQPVTNEWDFIDYMESFTHWLIDQDADVMESGTHWLVVDVELGEAYIMDEKEGMDTVCEQELFL